MFDSPVRISRWEPGDGKRILVVSDIHGNLDYFKALLKKAAFSEDDELVIDGDFLEKGPESLNTLRYIMKLCQKGNVHPVIGNCDGWDYLFDMPSRAFEYIRHYLAKKRCGLLWDMFSELGIDPLTVEPEGHIDALRGGFEAEWAFLSALPHAIETDNYIFAHAGCLPDKPLEEHSQDQLIRCDRFLSLGLSFSKWVIVGHHPVMLYGGDKVCANPIIDREHKIVSIDGACVLKDDGQLNALIIPDKHSDEFSFLSYDHFPLRTVMADQAAGARSYYIRWGDSTVEVLERGVEFSRCRHLRTGYEMDILTKYLFTDGKITDCNDCTDYVLPLKKGDTVSVVEKTSRGYLVKHKGFSGWYYGELQ